LNSSKTKQRMKLRIRISSFQMLERLNKKSEFWVLENRGKMTISLDSFTKCGEEKNAEKPRLNAVFKF